MKSFSKLAVFLALSGLVTAAVAADIDMPNAATLIASLGAQGATMKHSGKNSGVYIVRMADDPVVAYDGVIQGLQATKPEKNQKINPKSQAVIRYADYLNSKHDDALAKVGGGKKLYSYKYSFNGFAAELSTGQLGALRKQPGVISVTPDEMRTHDTISTSDMLNLAAGIWGEVGGTGNAGEDIIVGIIDTGIWPENPSFSDRIGNKLVYRQIPGWNGKCTPGESFPASKCNQKMISAQWFNQGFGGDDEIKKLFPNEYVSARDANGHGSHTASTAAGNNGVDVVINGQQVGTASGMAPRARIATYKVCWGSGSAGENAGGCAVTDSVAAIDQAVADGVDVLNFSISGSLTNFLDPVEVAFLFAAAAGVFVAASAGNSGPVSSTVAHNSPWLTTVAAGTHDRGYTATVTIADGSESEGVSLGSGAGPAALVYAADVVAADADPEEGRLCYPGTLNTDLVADKIVLCDRGEIARVDKSLAVAQAGGVGMILVNVSPGSLNADFHSVPTVHVDEDIGDSLRAYAQTDGASATLSAGTQVVAEAPEVAAFSSRGPALAGRGNLLKPDIMAPGKCYLAKQNTKAPRHPNSHFLLVPNLLRR
jgi:hypothetical protein